jgi:hypothetical protein
MYIHLETIFLVRSPDMRCRSSGSSEAKWLAQALGRNFGSVLDVSIMYLMYAIRRDYLGMHSYLDTLRF